MNLSIALRVHSGSIVTFTGAGGKTTAMLRLGRELAAAGHKVIATTTTRLGVDQLNLFPAHLVSPTPGELAETLEKTGFVVVVQKVEPERNKALGFLPDAIASFRNLADVVLVEGDGSRQLPLKAPGPDEPVIPPDTTHLVTLLGLWALGQPLGPETVHRPDIFAQLTGLTPGDVITPAALVRLANHPDGPARGAPAGAERFLLLNGIDKTVGSSSLKVENSFPDERLPLNLQPSTFNLSSRFSAILLAQLAHDPPVLASYGQTAAIVLAAGQASRFGSPKQLYEWHGQPLLRHVVEKTLVAPVQQIIVVLGAYFEETARVLHGLPVTLVHNASWEQGQSASIQAGLRACAPGTQVAMFVLGDQPDLPIDIFQRLIETHRHTLAPIVAPRHEGRRGNPVLFDRQCFPELMRLQGDTGGRDLFKRHLEQISWVEAGPEILYDIDRPENI